ncbi:hypothetical protein V0N53_004587 [Salmonella enterica]|nr:hypothetical protein [Salmonella enterica]
MKGISELAAGAVSGLAMVLAGLCELASVAALLAAALNALEIHSIFDRLYPAFSAVQWLGTGVGMGLLPVVVWGAAKAVMAPIRGIRAHHARIERERFHRELFKRFMGLAMKRKTNETKPH